MERVTQAGFVEERSKVKAFGVGLLVFVVVFGSLAGWTLVKVIEAVYGA